MEKDLKNIGSKNEKLPIGIQSFEKLREEGFKYVDKTEYIYKLAQNNVPCFLSRPRRFGKSLFLSTLKAYFEGKSELFNDLYIKDIEDKKKEPWIKYPVFYFDFNGQNYLERGSLEKILEAQLSRYEEKYFVKNSTNNLGLRFENLIIEVSKKSGLRCVILVDEYDKPLLDVMQNHELEEYNTAVFKGFFSVLKGLDEYIHFVFITGVTKFEKVSIFSDLNQLRDISMTKDFAGICGIKEEELLLNFDNEIFALAESQDMTKDECLAKLKCMYDGYAFHQNGMHVYNPFSILNSFSDKEFKPYWFSTATPTFLVTKIRNASFDIRKFDNDTIYANETALFDYRLNDEDVVPLLFQTGYITITGYDDIRRRYTLRFPNDEVKYGFLESLIPSFAPNMTVGNGLDIYSMDECFAHGNYDEAMIKIQSLFAGIPYPTVDTIFEYNFQSVLYIIFELLGRFVDCERHTFKGRIDCVVKYPEYIYVFEFKVDDSAENALKQINEKEYTIPFIGENKKIIKIGVNFSSQERKLVEYLAE